MSCTRRHWNNRIARSPSRSQEVCDRRCDGLIDEKPERQTGLDRCKRQSRPKKTENDQEDALQQRDEVARECKTWNGEVRNGQTQQGGRQKKSDTGSKQPHGLAR